MNDNNSVKALEPMKIVAPRNLLLVPEDAGRRPPRRRHAGGNPPEVSPWLVAFFTRYVRRYVPRHFRAVRLSKSGPVPELGDGPAVVFLNHPSWWDPLIALVIATEFFPRRRHYAPMDAASLAKFPIFRRLGFFGVERGTTRGARDFLRTSRAILATSDAMLWLTPEGRFSDPRERPIRLEPGLAHLACDRENATLIPLALEYAFWDDRLPEALARFGEPIEVDAVAAVSDTREWQDRLTSALVETQDSLAADALTRDASAFTPLIVGTGGVGGIYGMWQRLTGRQSQCEPGDSEGRAS